MYQGHRGGIGLELCLCLPPKPVARHLDDLEFMAAASR
jgi:hypothetical protein